MVATEVADRAHQFAFGRDDPASTESLVYARLWDMNPLPRVLLSAFLSLQSIAALHSQTRDEKFRTAVDGMFAELVQTRRNLHANPELSNEEKQTSRVVADKLKSLGLEVTEGIAGYGIVALLKGKSEGRCLAVRADMDGLPIKELRSVPYRSRNPGVMHACGHDVHVTVALGVAELLSRFKDDVQGTVKFIFQPAEEGMPATFEGDWGAKKMVAEGVMENPKPEAILALHSSTAVTKLDSNGADIPAYLEAGELGWNIGPTNANSDRFKITINGQMAHGSAPHRGVDAIAVAAQVINALQLIRSRETNTQQPLVITVGTIQGGQRENVIADRVEMAGTVRTYDDALQSRVIDLMKRTIEGITAAHGATAEFHYRKSYPMVVNEAPLVNKLLPTMRRIAGNDQVIELRPGMGGEDFSYFSRLVPGFYFRLGCANVKEGITGGQHTPEFDVDERALKTGVEAMAAMVCDFLQD
ncbi:MAG: amidohydrolase [Verrucomicrobiaceae bacterium]|nr:amidohydrolase [Verrucomicrobiaceae bacterium]